MASSNRIFLHTGLPRTATTVLQKEVFPKLASMHYVGKPADNRAMLGRLKPVLVAKESCERIRNGDYSAIGDLRALTNSLIIALKDISLGYSSLDPKVIFRAWMGVFDLMEQQLGDKPLLYSDEALSESTSGLLANLDYRDDVALEQFRDWGWLEDVSVSVVLREPIAFLRASYYKTMEFKHKLGKPPIAFEQYIVIQQRILDRHSSASRIFLCMHEEATRHFKSLAPRMNVVHYEDLVQAPNVLDSLLAVRSGEPATRLRDLGRENPSWRKQNVNQFLLQAPGVPQGITVEDYAATFPETLRKLSLGHLLSAHG